GGSGGGRGRWAGGGRTPAGAGGPGWGDPPARARRSQRRATPPRSCAGAGARAVPAASASRAAVTRRFRAPPEVLGAESPRDLQIVGRFIPEDEGYFVLANEAHGRMREYRPTVTTARTLVARYWFDALVLAGIGLAIAFVVVDRNHEDGVEGPLWLDVVLVVAIMVPFFLRRRFPLGALVAIPVIVCIAAWLDGRLVPDNPALF